MKTFNVKDYGAKGDGITDDHLAIQHTICMASADGGGVVFIENGTYLCMNGILLMDNIILQGTGKMSSILKFTGTGFGIKMTSLVNGSTAVNTKTVSLGIVNDNQNNLDGGFVDVAGSLWSIENCRISGFKYGIILDQSELADVVDCEFVSQILAGAWIVNGPEYTQGAQPGFTNRISFQRCQFNHNESAISVINDGGTTHSFKDCNFNGGLNHIISAGVHGQLIESCHFESAVGANIILKNTGYYNGSSGQGLATTILSSSITKSWTSNYAIITLSQGKLNLIGSMLNGSGYMIGGLSNCYQLFAAGNHGLTSDGIASIDNRF